MESVTRFFSPPEESFFLFGPRGTGKTTLLKHTFPDAYWIDFNLPETFRLYSSRPERLLDLLKGHKSGSRPMVIIDEVQKLPEILGLVHSIIESKSGWCFALTGSSSRKLKRTGVNLLGGRAILCTLHPFLATELGTAFNLEYALRFGCLPLVVSAKRPLPVLSTYVALYVNEEVKAEGLVRNIGGFSRFLEAISFSHGAVLNISNVARECQVGQKTVEGYVNILEDLLLAFRVPVFKKKATRDLVSHSKLYLFDAGVFRSLRPKGLLDRPSEIDGAALEGLIAQQLRTWASLCETPPELSYWRTNGGIEVDFVVYGENEFTAIEVKNSLLVRPEDLRGLISFRNHYPECTALLAYRGKERLMQHGIICLPVEELLQSLIPGRAIAVSVN